MNTIPNVEKLTALQKKMADLMGAITAPVEVEPVPVEVSKVEEAKKAPSPKKTRDLEFEIEREHALRVQDETNETMDAVFGAFDGLQDRANTLRFQRTRTATEEAELVGLDRKIVGLTETFMQDPVLHGEWIALHLDRADEYRVSQDFVANGILREITSKEKEENSADWAAYKTLSQKEKDSGEFLRPPTVWTVREDPRDPNTAHYYVKVFVPKEKWVDGKNPWTDEKRELLAAYVAHHQRMREEASTRRAEREAVEAERQFEDNQLSEAMDPDVDSGLTLDKIADGVSGLARVALLPEHDWRSHPAAAPMTGVMYVRGRGLADGSKEIARLQIVGATGGLRGYLAAKSVSFVGSFHYKVGRQFAGISDSETREDKGFLRALFAAAMGYKKSHTESPVGFNNPLAALGSGHPEETTAPPAGRQNGHGHQRVDRGQQQGRRHDRGGRKSDDKGRGGAKNLTHQWS